jgi:radical SAM superfamily enzyme
LEHIPPDWIIQRLTGDPNPGELVAPNWALEKKKTLELIRIRLEKTFGYQGRKYIKLENR